MNEPKKVTAAILRKDGKILIARRRVETLLRVNGSFLVEKLRKEKRQKNA
jgi:hypothetical protein